MKRKIKDSVFGRTTGDIALQHCLGEALDTIVIDRLTSENIGTEEVDIVLTIDGKEYDHEEFFKHLSNNYSNYLKNQAKKLIVEDTLDKIDELKNSLEILTSQVNSLGDALDMEFLKKNEED